MKAGFNLCRYCPVRSTATHFEGGTLYRQFLLSQRRNDVHLRASKCHHKYEIATRFSSLKCIKTRFAGGPYDAPLYLLVGWGPAVPSPSIVGLSIGSTAISSPPNQTLDERRSQSVSRLTIPLRVGGSDVDRGQTPQDEAEDEDKTPRTRTRPRTKPRGRGRGRGRGQNH